ncbi:Uma2 family endonuclease [Streptomyces aurantiacus]|uniref:Uma2 family endonuclease n=1 Tax=Streptomyces aurantiacus TaxID=47760 RepID=UPI0027917A7C|nr:Uma2 family endonuclease [Streptomyces aurantiacus]MDQ0774719.1 Uma2 family endonuclease [Streptomyces aurantiacus]
MSVASIDHTGPWTVADVLALPEDRRYRYELYGESLIMSPAPGVRHQRASHRLHVAIDAAAEAAGVSVEVLEAVNVITPSGLFVPDLVVVDAGATADDPVSIDAEAVLLAVELVSPGNAPMDRKLKPLAYAEAHIPHFWRVEFDPSPRIVMGMLDRGRYVEQADAIAGAVTTVDEPFPFAIDPAQLARR